MEAEGSGPDVALLEALPQVAWVADAAGVVWFVNGRGRAYLGLAPSEVYDYDWLATVHPEDRAAAERAWERAVAGAEPFEAEYRIRRHDGAYRWHRDRGAVLRDDTGAVTGWVGTSTDVHARHVADEGLDQARQQLEEQLAVLDALQQNAPVGLGLLDRDLRLVRANHALVEMSRLPLGELIGRPVRELAPEAWDQLEPILRRVATERITVSGIPVEGQDPEDPTRARRWSVGYYPVEGDGDLIGIGVVSEDVTERLERVQRLQSSEELRELAERAGALGSWEYDLRTERTRWSPGLRSVLGVGPDAVASPETFIASLHPDDRPKFPAEVRRLLRTGEPGTVRYRARRPDGQERILEARAACDVEEGRVTRVFGTTQDVTEEVRRVERVAQVERLLKEAESIAAMGSFETLLPSGDTVLSPGLWELIGREPARDGVDASALDDLFESIHPDDRERQRRDFAHLAATGELLTRMLRIVRPDGTERLLELRGSSYRDADGAPERLVGVALDVTERERLHRERAELIERSLTAADHERRRIAEHLHDDAVQALIATLLRLDHAVATGTTEPLVRARQTLESAVRSLRLNIMELSPFDIAEDGLEAAVGAYAQQLLEVDGVNVAVHVALGEERDVPGDALLASYRIIREALSNVRRHADAREVVVRLERQRDTIVGTVVDDGVGIEGEVASRPGHLGVQLMQQRAELAGGEVTIRRRADEGGTEVAWCLPLVTGARRRPPGWS